MAGISHRVINMLYRNMPENGERLSILGYGCMRLPVCPDGSIDEQRARTQVRYAIDEGVNYVDTAWSYHGGKCEAFLGRVLGDGYREKVKLATKLPSWLIKTREDMDHYLNTQLERLNTDHIDYYLLHSLGSQLWENVSKAGVIDFLDSAKADGRIINAGFSYHGTGEFFSTVVDAYDWDFCQIQYNYLDEFNQAGTAGLKYAASKGLGVIVMEPLRGGNLAGEAPVPVQRIWDRATVKRSPAEWGLRWVWDHPEVTVVLSGMNEEEHVKENLRIASEAYPRSLTPSELELFPDVVNTYQKIMKVGCTGCRYCRPCPEGVDIPGCLEIYNYMHMFGEKEHAKFLYAAGGGGVFTDGKRSFASQCVGCGKCVDRCPQGLSIPDILKDVVKDLEGPGLELRIKLAELTFRDT